ncbi:MAG TPA: hypothetical protein VFI28_09580 [Candidatus Limnocylindrales bacterium]|nr:hypothetical protein [Candidatus Limnocylindrales bacterium]
MRPRPLVASVALTASLALVALPGLVGSKTPSPWPSAEAAAFQAVLIRADDRAGIPVGPLDAARRSVRAATADSVLIEPAVAQRPSSSGRGRPSVTQPGSPVHVAVRPPRYVMHGWASFYDNGTTAMRLPRGTFVRICGNGGCIERTVNDYGPSSTFRPVRIVDMYRPDFFAICGCGGWAGTAEVTVSVY